MSVVRVKTIADFLRRRIKTALESESIDASEWTEFYLVNLLLNNQLSNQVCCDHDSNMHEEPLGIEMLEAWNKSNEAERANCLRHIGDKALYISGVFAEHVAANALLSLDYYEAIGRGAYSSLSEIMEGKSISELFEELSDNFKPLAHVLGIAIESDTTNSASSLLKLYEMWLETRDDRLLKKLHRHGLVPQGEKQ